MPQTGPGACQPEAGARHRSGFGCAFFADRVTRPAMEWRYDRWGRGYAEFGDRYDGLRARPTSSRSTMATLTMRRRGPHPRRRRIEGSGHGRALDRRPGRVVAPPDEPARSHRGRGCQSVTSWSRPHSRHTRYPPRSVTSNGCSVTTRRAHSTVRRGTGRSTNLPWERPATTPGVVEAGTMRRRVRSPGRCRRAVGRRMPTQYRCHRLGWCGSHR